MTSRDKRTREYRGGLLSYDRAKRDIQSWIREAPGRDCYFTTMFDLYALPNDFPSYAEAMRLTDPYERTRIIETAISEDVNDHRFIPYVQLHEFEALIFADPQQLDWEYLEHAEPIERLKAIVAETINPELINDGPTTAPSKRILAEIPEYDKVTAGVHVAAKIGLDTIRQKCSHFNEWVTELEKL
nr:DUF4276 family protein [Pseudodesulfovibrio alkaliphilus]